MKLRTGKEIVVHFHHENTDQPTTFSWNEIKEGKTMAILYARKKSFADFTKGVRQENLDSVFIFKASLETLCKTAEVINSTTKKCWHPQCNAESSDSIMFKCSRCSTALYCGKEHQALNWTHHKSLCRQLPTILRLLEIVKLPFKGFYDFHFNLESLSDERIEVMKTLAMDEFMINHGNYSSKMLQKRSFEKLLAEIVKRPDWIRSAVDTTSGGNYEALRMMLPHKFSDTIAGKALLESCLRLECSACNAVIDFNESDEFDLFSLLLLPFWASQILPKMCINWYIQAEPVNAERLYVTGGWSRVNSALLLRHTNGSSVCFDDTCSVLCNLSTCETFSKHFPGWTVRILLPIPGHAEEENDYGDRTAIRTSLFSPPKALKDSFTIWCRMDSLFVRFRRQNSPYGDARENEAEAMFEALTLVRRPHIHEICPRLNSDAIKVVETLTPPLPPAGREGSRGGRYPDGGGRSVGGAKAQGRKPRQPCRNWSGVSGSCRFGSKCRFDHI